MMTPYNVTVADIISNISALRGSKGGGKDKGIVEVGGEEAYLVPTDDMGLDYARTPNEVHRP